MRSVVAIIALVVVPAAGCGEEADDSCQVREPGNIDPAGVSYRYVIDSIDLPNTPSESQAYGMVLDGNSQERPNNAMGVVLSTVFNVLDSDLDGNVKAAVDDGRILHLLEVQATSLDDATGVGVQLFLGVDRDDDPADNFSGQELFDIDTETAPMSQPLAGQVIRGRLSADLGSAPLRIVLPHVDTPFTLQLEAARIETDLITATEIRGRIGGVLTEQEIADHLLPIVHTSLSASVAIDCIDGVCEPGSQGEQFLEVFDDDHDGALSFSEVENSSLVRSLLAPDVDLFDDDGNVNPGCDGIKDGLSVGVGFTATAARF